MKADDVVNMENNDAEMEYITLPSPGIYSNMQSDQIENYTGPNEYQYQESSCVQNHVNNSNCHFGYYNYSASPNSCSCCCGYDSNGNNIESTAQNTQNYGQVEYQYEYADQSNIGQYSNMNRCAGGMENYAANSPLPPMAYHASNGNHNIENFSCDIEQQTQSNYFAMPSLDNLGINMNPPSPDYWSGCQDSEDPDDAIQSQSVYSSDFQPPHEAGNKFNHFPNNNLKEFRDLINSRPSQSASPEYSYQLGDPTYDMDDNQDGDGNQMQSYPMSNANYMQMCSS